MRRWIWAIFLLFPLFSGAQSALVDSLNALQGRIASGPEAERISYAESCANYLREALKDPASFRTDYSELKGMGALLSPDEVFRLYNWNLSLDNGTHRYYCFIQFNPELEYNVPYIELTQMQKEPDKLESRQFDADEWLGCLYYEIVPVRQSKSKTYYVLFGWDGHNRMTTRKFIEVLQINGEKLRFGSPVFKTGDGVKKRMVYEFSPEVQMSIRYNQKQRRIIFDHLSPRSPGLEGNYAFYGPDLTFDSFFLKKGIWVFEADIDVRMEKDDKPYYNPRPE